MARRRRRRVGREKRRNANVHVIIEEWFRRTHDTTSTYDISRRDATGIPDPILNVYINQERRFAFIEFKTMEMASAVLAFDGINILGMGKVKIKRPNDYNPTIVPELNPNALPSFDTSQLGIVSTTVPDGPDKIFIGGLHYHLTDDQVLELLEAFGPVKAFNLVKGELGSSMNKGFGFVQYADPATTPIAIMGLNGMDIGGGKAISARGAGQRSSAPAAPAGMPAAISAYQPQPPSAPPVPVPGAAGNIVNGVDVDALLNAAMGGGGGAARSQGLAQPGGGGGGGGCGCGCGCGGEWGGGGPAGGGVEGEGRRSEGAPPGAVGGHGHEVVEGKEDGRDRPSSSNAASSFSAAPSPGPAELGRCHRPGLLPCQLSGEVPGEWTGTPPG